MICVVTSSASGCAQLNQTDRETVVVEIMNDLHILSLLCCRYNSRELGGESFVADRDGDSHQLFPFVKLKFDCFDFLNSAAAFGGLQAGTQPILPIRDRLMK